MKLNIACPTTGGQKSYDIDDDKKLRIFNDLRISEEVDATPLGDEFAGYVLRIMGGNDKQGFPMKQGVLTNGRVKLLLKPHSVGFRRGRHDGVRKRRTVRGCIVGNDLSVLNLVIVKKGKAEIPGLTDVVVQQRVGPKRASRIRKLFNLSKDDDVRKYAICKVRPSKKGGKEHKRMPHIQRLVTSRTLQHRRRIMAIKKKRWANATKERADYLQLLRTRTQEQRQRQHEMFHKRHEAQKLKKMMALRKAIAKRRDEKFRAKERRMAVIRRRTEANKAAGGRRKLTEEEIAEKIRKTRAARRTRWLKARAELRKKRFAALVRWRKEKKERRKLVKACDSLKSLTLKEKRRLINKRVDAELLAKKKNRYAIFSKKGAVKALGKAARPYGRKASLARKAAAKAAKAAKAASDPKKTQKQQKMTSKEQPQKQQQQKQQQLPPPKEQKQQQKQQQPPKKVQQKKQQQQQQPPQTKKAKK